MLVIKLVNNVVNVGYKFGHKVIMLVIKLVNIIVGYKVG